MTGCCGTVESIIRRGSDAYQLTLGIYLREDGRQLLTGVSYQDHGQAIIYRVDIAIDDNRTILFPDRQLDKCMDVFYRADGGASPTDGLEGEWMVGRIADRICREVTAILLERNLDTKN